MADIQIRRPRKNLPTGEGAQRVASARAESLAKTKIAGAHRGAAHVSRAAAIAKRRPRRH